MIEDPARTPIQTARLACLTQSGLRWINALSLSLALFPGLLAGLQICSSRMLGRHPLTYVPIHTIVAMALIVSALNLGLACRALAGTSLRPAVIWAILAVLIAAVGQGSADTNVTGHPREAIFSHLAFLATLAALVSVLGARRPGETAWAILCGLFIGIGLLPLMEGMALSKPFDILDRLRLDSPWNWFFLLVVFAGISNYIPTRHFKSSICLALGLVVHLYMIWRPAGRAEWRGDFWWVLPWCISITVLMPAVWNTRGMRSNPADSFHDVWLPFRDAWGAAWALRVLERFNQASIKNQWPLRLQWFGLYPAENSTPEELAQFGPDQLLPTLLIFVRRFGDPDRIRRLDER